MKRSSPTPDAPTLFELPEEEETPTSREPRDGESGGDPADNLELFAEAPRGDGAEPVGKPPPEPEPLSLTSARAQAGLLDLAVIVAVLLGIVGGTALMGVSSGPDAWPALLLVAGVFSFLYTTVPLAFWGRTPGMARYGVVARNEAGRPLTFGQTFLRWLAAVITVGLVGLPALLILGGRSLADRLSGSRTRLRP